MRSPFGHIAESAIRRAVMDGWNLAVGELRYLPEGGGAYHWIAGTGETRRWFVTCDDLDTKPWLGNDRDTVFDRLLAAYQAAIDLRASGLKFVIAPRATVAGAPAVRVDDRYSVSTFDYVAGAPAQWGRAWSDDGVGEVVAVLAALHRSTPIVHDVARRELELPGRADLEQALAELGRSWDGGPLSEPARLDLVRHQELVGGWLGQLDRSAYPQTLPVVTHGEPHPGNFIRHNNALGLVDWDTVALAPPELDLWMVADGQEDDIIRLYRDLTGVSLDRAALASYRLLWALTDAAAFTVQLRRPHRHDADAERALAGLRSILNGHEPAPYGTRVAPS